MMPSMPINARQCALMRPRRSIVFYLLVPGVTWSWYMHLVYEPKFGIEYT